MTGPYDQDADPPTRILAPLATAADCDRYRAAWRFVR